MQQQAIQSPAHPLPFLAGGTTQIAYPLDVGLKKIAVGRTKGYELIEEGELETYTVGSRRYVTHAALERFIANRIAAERETRLAGGAQ
ncbi:MerR family transcriptional regulator [Imhoffiella purpurea]|uniref:helix-turn-helix domain-containing protein n=1 Tax=Imhoffiella purpurea TaxID=1249627 RepID=UPI0005C1DF8D|nr:helix-turn-helix domain-containing protein [Imhoffiella purpurea]